MYANRYFGNPGEHYLYLVRDSYNTDARYSYNVLGSLLSTTRAGVSRSFQYFSTNLLREETHPESGKTSYTRDGVGNLKTKTENGQTITYNYDSLNRLGSANTSNVSYKKSYIYDNANNLTNLVSYGATVNNQYDPANRLTKRTSTINGKSAATSFYYDAYDNLEQINYPSGLVVQYDHNTENQVTKVYGFGADITGVAYHTTTPYIGLLKSYKRPGNKTVSFSWDKRRKLKSASHSNLALDFKYDSRGNLTQFNRAGKNQTFGYDQINRITIANGPWQSGSYSYDNADNRKTKVINGARTTYDYSANKLIKEGTKPFTYNGPNITKSG